MSTPERQTKRGSKRGTRGPVVPDRPNTLNERFLDYEAILFELMQDPQRNAIQVHNGDGGDQDITEFGGDTADQIREVIHYIETNRLQDEKPWSIIWNLWKLLQHAIYGPPDEPDEYEPEAPALDFD